MSPLPFLFPRVAPHQGPGAKNYITKSTLKENLLPSTSLILQLFQECLCCQAVRNVCLSTHPHPFENPLLMWMWKLTSMKEKWGFPSCNANQRSTHVFLSLHRTCCWPQSLPALPCPPFAVCFKEAVRMGMLIHLSRSVPELHLFFKNITDEKGIWTLSLSQLTTQKVWLFSNMY